MMTDSIASFLTRIRDDLGVHLEAGGPSAADSEFADLNGLLRLHDGIKLPFLELFERKRFDDESLPGWCIFGFDGYFTYAVAKTEASSTQFDLWDHESGLPPEGSFSSLIELLEFAYEEYLAAGREAVLRVESIPETIKPAKLVPLIRPFFDETAKELLSRIRAGSLSISSDELSSLIELRRKLNTLGISSQIGVGA